MKDVVYINERVGIVPEGYPNAVRYVGAIDVTADELLDEYAKNCSAHNNCSGCGLWDSHNTMRCFARFAINHINHKIKEGGR